MPMHLFGDVQAGGEADEEPMGRLDRGAQDHPQDDAHHPGGTDLRLVAFRFPRGGDTRDVATVAKVVPGLCHRGRPPVCLCLVERSRNKPLKGFVQILQVIIFLIGGILIISVLINRSPVSLLAGLGASAAIMTLVFKDTILGFVAGIQLSMNDMLRPGDWITMEKYGANGTVTEVTLYAVKVRNFDNTITTIPPYALVSDAFQNWRAMTESPGRRIKRSINIDMTSVCFCTPEMLERFRKISLIRDYIEFSEQDLEKYNTEYGIDGSVPVNGHRLTNLGVFRAYLVRYLRSLPEINKELVCMVRHLQPTDTGIPIELYCFSSNKEWVEYERIQADLFDHVLAIVPEFGLRVYQRVSGADVVRLAKN